jgi:2-methylisocitrate lyase-like PEP mutase family enzyme
MPDLASLRARFRELHRAGCFVIPNPWDRGSARLLAQLGFPALATSSAGLAFSLGLPDTVTALPRAAVMEHVRAVVEATGLPVNADLQSGYADSPEGVVETVELAVQAGVSGLSIEDASGVEHEPLYPLPVAVERIAAARAALDASGSGVLLTARAESFLVRHPQPLQDVLSRLTAYADAGADVLFAPGLREAAQIRAVVEAVAPRPVNVLVGANLGLRVADLAELGVRRVSVGSALARTAWTAFLRAAREIASDGEFTSFEGLASVREMSDLFEKG